MRTGIFIAIFLLVAVCGFTSVGFAANPQIEQHDADMTADHLILESQIDQLLSSSSPTLPMGVGVIQAGATVTIYQSYGQHSNVTVTVSDYSTGLDSILTWTRSTSNSPVNVTIPDNNTITAAFHVRTEPQGGGITLECRGTGGFCLYKIDDVRTN